MPSIAYSTGSSIVRILGLPSLSCLKTRIKRGVVLPEPVGPRSQDNAIGFTEAQIGQYRVGAFPTCRAGIERDDGLSLVEYRITPVQLARFGKVDTRTSAISRPCQADPASCGIRRSPYPARINLMPVDDQTGRHAAAMAQLLWSARRRLASAPTAASS